MGLNFGMFGKMVAQQQNQAEQPLGKNPPNLLAEYTGKAHLNLDMFSKLSMESYKMGLENEFVMGHLSPYNGTYTSTTKITLK